jgi:cytoskeleton protein RodZ
VRSEYPLPAPESGIPSGTLLSIAVVLGMVVYGVWYTMADADRRAADVIQEVPARLAALLKSDEQSSAVGESSTETAQPTSPQTADEQPEMADASAQSSTTVSSPPESQTGPTTAAPVPEPAAAPAVVAVNEPKPAPAVVATPTPSSTPAATPTTTPNPAPIVATQPAQTPAPVVAAAPTAAPANVPATQPATPAPTAAVPAPRATTPVAQTTTPAPQPSATPAPVRPTPAPTTVASAPTTPAAVNPMPNTPSPVQPTATPAPRPAAPVATAAAPTPRPAASAQTAAAGKNAVELRAKSDSWIQVRDGEQLLLTRFLRKGETYKVPERQGLTLMTLNAGGIEIMVDGQMMPPLGDTGSVARGVSLDAARLKATPRPAAAQPPPTPPANAED